MSDIYDTIQGLSELDPADLGEEAAAEVEGADDTEAEEAEREAPSDEADAEEAEGGNDTGEDDESDDDEADPGGSDDPILEMDGKAYTENELRELRDSGLRQADYTRKTQALAEERKAIEAERTAIQQQTGERLQAIDAVLADLQALNPYQDVNWRELAKDDPDEYAVKKEEAADYQAKVEKARQTRQALLDQNRVQAQRETASSLATVIPEWSDSKVMQAEAAAMVQHMKAEGFTSEELNDLSLQPRYVKLARDAAKYREMQQAAASAKGKKEPAKAIKTLKPGAKKSAKGDDQRKVKALSQRARKTGHERDAASAIAALDIDL